jgi:HK97 family phage major capsid protein
MAVAAGRGNRQEAADYAKLRFADTPEVEQILRTPASLIAKAAVEAGTTLDATWAAPLVVYQNLTAEFVELLRAETIIGKMTGLRRVPFNVTIPSQTAGSTVGWVGQSAPKPVSELAFSSISLGIAKAAGIVVINEELARSSSPSAEALVRQDLHADFAHAESAWAAGVSWHRRDGRNPVRDPGYHVGQRSGLRRFGGFTDGRPRRAHHPRQAERNSDGGRWWREHRRVA